MKKYDKLSIEEKRTFFLRKQKAINDSIMRWMLLGMLSTIIAIIILPSKSDNGNYVSLMIVFDLMLIGVSAFAFIKAHRINISW